MQDSDDDLDELMLEPPTQEERAVRKTPRGQHLMRVRVRLSVWRELNVAAEYESERIGEHVSASDLVRAAVNNFLALHQVLQSLENMPPSSFDNDDLVIVVDDATGMLQLGADVA